MLEPDKSIALDDVTAEMDTGDILLFRHPGIIARIGRSVYSHAGMIIRHSDHANDIDLAEMVVRGGQVCWLRGQVMKYPGRWDWYCVDRDRFPDFRTDGKVMLELAKGRYGMWSLFRASLLRLPFLRLIIGTDMDDLKVTTYPAHCSQAIARDCLLRGGIDPVRKLANRLTEPADLSRSLLWRDRGTLV